MTNELRTGTPVHRRRLTPEEIADIRSRHQILDVLRREGLDTPSRESGSGDVMISCPRPGHSDSTPSCVVHPSSNRFYCFGCGAHGDVFTLVTELTGLTSLRDIADVLESGRPIGSSGQAAVFREGALVAARPRLRQREAPEEARSSLSRVLEVNDEAWRFLTSSRLADRARCYIARRGFDLWSIESEVGSPAVGHTPSGRSALVAHLCRCGFAGDEILDAGWAVRRDSGLADRFFGRVLFPVRDDAWQLIGVIARDVTGRSHARYVNTPRTIAYHKGSVLYRPLQVAHADRVVVCEGPVDALAITATAIRAGMRTILGVAPSGTALTAVQARQIVAIGTSEPIVCADGDGAGRVAASKWIATLRAEHGAPLLATLPPDEDPASWLHREGIAGLESILNASATPVALSGLPRHVSALPTL